jgi:hypothetical protein
LSGVRTTAVAGRAHPIADLVVERLAGRTRHGQCEGRDESKSGKASHYAATAISSRGAQALLERIDQLSQKDFDITGKLQN